jgi:glycosyltransferase involved in cell wall biosynthesis
VLAPLVSVVIATRNRREPLERCLAALARQRFRDFEVVVVDDGSVDTTPEIADFFDGVRVIRQEHRGAAAARNLGVRNALGELVAFTDDDCIPDEGWLEAAMARFAEPGVVAVEGRTVSTSPERSPTSLPLVNLHGGKLATCNMIYRRQAILDAGGFAEAELPFLGEDRDLAHRVRRVGSIVFEPAAVVAHPVRHLTLGDFIRHHLRLRQTYWQVRFLRHTRAFITWETAIFYPFLAALALAIARPEVSTLLLAAACYAGGALLHNLILTRATVQDALRHPRELAGWLTLWWVVMAADLAFRAAGIVRFRRILL